MSKIYPYFSWISIVCGSMLALISCGQADYSPKPRAYHRIVLPQKSYTTPATGCPYTFALPAYAQLLQDLSPQTQPCWQNVDFPAFNARLHLSYFPISQQTTLQQLSEDARTFAFKHTAKASAIQQEKIHDKQRKVYGVTYYIQGNTASNLQFYVTDSSRHYLRGALYFHEKPNLDSIQPVLDFLALDIEQLIHSFAWK